MIKFKNKKAFTLVELIIVITILAILATIVFISFQGYSKNARDGNRLTALRNIKSGLEIYYTQTGNYPDTESGTLIQSSGGLTTIGTQGYFGDTNSRLLKFSKTPTDPYDGTKYIYSINSQKNKYQIMGFLETSDYLSLVKNTYAANYSKRIPKTLGDNLGILLDVINNPISGTGIDIENYTGSLKAVFSDNKIEIGTGILLKGLKNTFNSGKFGWGFYDINCDLPDVVIGNQVWAGCNSTIGYGTERGQSNNDIGKETYNGSLSLTTSCFDYSGNTGSTTLLCTKGAQDMLSNKKASDWFKSLNNNGDSEVNNIWGKFYTWSDMNTNCKGGDFSGINNNNNCPCPTGWHVPTIDELEKSQSYLYGGNCDIISPTRYCSGQGWKGWNSNINNFVNLLKIPMSGEKDYLSYMYYGRGERTRLWSSSTDGGYSVSQLFDPKSNSIFHGGAFRDYGFNVRCIKD